MNISLRRSSAAVSLVGLFVAQSLSAATVIWSGAGGLNENWSGPNWTGGTPGPTNDIRFFDPAALSPAGAVNNIVDANLTVASLQYGNSNSFHTTLINPGVTLTVSNGVAGNVLLAGTGTDNGGTQPLVATVAGTGGTLAVVGTNTGSAFNVRQGSTTSGTHRATLDLSGLDTLTLAVGRLLVGGDGTGTAAVNRPAGTLYLARTNTIRLNGAAPAVDAGDGSSNGGTQYVYLGQTNALFADSMTIGRQKCTATLAFNPTLLGSSPALYLRGNTAVRVSALALGDNSAQSTSGTASAGTIDTSAGSVDAKVDVAYVGRGLTSTGVGTSTGTLTLGAGVFDVNTLQLGYVSSATAVATVSGTVNVNASGSLVVNTLLALGYNPGATAIAKGTLTVNGGAVFANAISASAGSLNANVTLNGGTLVLTNYAGTVAAPLTSLTLGDSTLSLFASGSFTNMVTGSLTTSTSTTNNTINVLSLPIITGYPIQFPLISYQSLDNFNFVLGTLPAGYQGYLMNNPAASRVDLVISSGPITLRALVWNGNLSGDWNTGTANWLNFGAATTYNQTDFVTFDDTAAGSTSVNLTTTLTPTSLTVSNNTKNYTLTGTGGLGGATGLYKQQAGTLTLANSGANTFSGAVTVAGGKLQIGGAGNQLPTNAAVTLADNATAVLDLNSLNQTLGSLTGGGATGGNVTLGTGTLTFGGGGGVYGGVISGAGQVVENGTGAQVLSGANLYTGGTLVSTGTLAVANTSGSGVGPGSVVVQTNATFALGGGGPGGSAAAGFITNNGTVTLNRSDDFALANVIVGSGNLTKNNTNTVLASTANFHSGLTSINAGALRVTQPAALGTLDSPTFIGNDATARLELMGGISVPEALLFSCKGSALGNPPGLVNVSGTNTLTGQISLTTGGSYWTVESDADQLTITGNLTNAATSNTRSLRLRGAAVGEIRGLIANSPGNLSITAVIKEETGTWVLSGNNVYTGSTTVNAGTLLVNGTLATGAVTVGGATLGGAGVINGPVTINPGGTLAPGTADVMATLTINNSLMLNDTTLMKVSHAAADKVAGMSTLTLGGTLQVVVEGTLTGGEVFKLFAATNYSGDFGAYQLPSLPSPLGWDSSSVPVDGTLRVTGGAPPQPTIAPVSLSTNNLIITVPTVSGGNYVLQSATNLVPPVAWANVSTNPGTGSNLILNVPIDRAQPRTFFRFWAY